MESDGVFFANEGVDKAKDKAGKAFEYKNIRNGLIEIMKFYDRHLPRDSEGNLTTKNGRQLNKYITELTQQTCFNLASETDNKTIIDLDKALHTYGDKDMNIPIKEFKSLVYQIYQQYTLKKIKVGKEDKKREEGQDDYAKWWKREHSQPQPGI